MLKRYFSVLLILTLWFFATAWNIDKAFHIDDAAHIAFAQWIAIDPWHPMRGLIFDDGQSFPIHWTNQPSLYFYLMALWAKFWGWSEVSMHALVALFSLWAIVCFDKLTKYFCEQNQSIQSLALCLFALCPAFVVGQNTMVDVPLLAMTLAFYWALLCPQYSTHQRYLLAGLLCSAALLTKYTSLVLIPAIALHMLVTNHKRYWAYLLIPISALVAWSLFNIADFGHPHLLGRSAGGSGGKLHWGQLRLIFWWIGILGSICPFAIAFFFSQYQQATSQLAKRSWLFLSLSSAIAPCLVIVCIAIKPTARWIDLIFNYTFLASGVGLLTLLFIAIRQAQKNMMVDRQAQTLLLVYWFISVSVFIVALAPFLAIRHALLAIPPLLLLLFSQASSSKSNLKMSKTLSILAITLSISITSLLALADNWFAGVYKEKAPQIALQLSQNLGPDQHIWYSGMWGWAWYAKKAGITPFDRQHPAMREGDLLITSEYGSQPKLPNLSLVETIEITPTKWYQYFASTGLYQSDMRPWQFRTEPIDILKVYRVEK
ncbi:hypothetical protein G6705_00150 [Polynucleobacter paneuropaeus]|nr:hypothetical protein [Polynucleobacter paneuropaeus]